MKLLRNLIIVGVSALVLGAGYYFAVKWEPKEPERPEWPNSESIVLFSVDKDDIERISVANSNGSFVFFTDGEVQPTTALTMGIGQIFAAKHILLIISGASKAEITRKLFDGKLHTDVPACFLLLHPNVTLIIDKAADGG